MRDTDGDWNSIAHEQPYWGVLSVDKFRGTTLSAELEAEFFATGERLVGDLLAFARAHLPEPFSAGSALDFGCGVGRLLLPLAKHYAEAVGIDVADRMLELARQHADKQGLRNVRLLQSDDNLSVLQGRSFDLVNSRIVLQHIPTERGYFIIRKLLDCLKVGGVGSLQLTYAKSRRFMQHELNRAEFYRRNGDTIQDILPFDEKRAAGSITMYDYDLNVVMAMLARVAGEPILVLPTNDDDHLGSHFVFKKARA